MLCQFYSADQKSLNEMQAIHIVGNKSALHLNRTLNDTAVIDLIDGTKQHHLPSYADLDKSFSGATGAFIKNKLLLCGGISDKYSGWNDVGR